eukprot:CAMPEP_0113944174 /NCGR_PEP_ID=MMETSP1339-20121228/30681_1 /TAXON_ID=94617 /ORGANISM="Fibrocapsa japonica" /LENGTH=415 /DNA_ID=CAMNT_0000949261 /DNA_START=206 /DNA_END=1453 /DNA_ORIENTATION=+ /assembly_acc=CAM_ASM_000762
MERLVKEKKVPEPSHGDLIPLSLDPGGQRRVDDPSTTLGALNIKHGDMLYLQLSTESLTVHEEAQGPKKINADGTITNQTYDDLSTKEGFRPGMMSLRSMKMQWTLNEFMELDDQFTFKIKRQEKPVTSAVTLDSASCNSFQNYVRQFGFLQARCGYLYGHYEGEDKSKVRVECVYEPPQNGFAEGFELMEDPNEDKVAALASMLQLERVGWIFSHPRREEGFAFSAAEVILAGELQLEAANGINDTPFVTVKVTQDEEGNAHFDAFQVSKQCMEMVAEGALEAGDDPGVATINGTFSAVVEGKEGKEVDTNFFLTVVPIEQHESERFVCMFPASNRDGLPQTRDQLKAQLQKVGQRGWTLVDLLADFHLLLFLTAFLDMQHDIPRICQSIVDKEVPLDEGFKLIIGSLAGLDSV